MARDNWVKVSELEVSTINYEQAAAAVGAVTKNLGKDKGAEAITDIVTYNGDPDEKSADLIKDMQQLENQEVDKGQNLADMLINGIDGGVMGEVTRDLAKALNGKGTANPAMENMQKDPDQLGKSS